MAAVHNGHINILRKLIKLGYTDKKAITSITIQDVLKMNVHARFQGRLQCLRPLSIVFLTRTIPSFDQRYGSREERHRKLPQERERYIQYR